MSGDVESNKMSGDIESNNETQQEEKTQQDENSITNKVGWYVFFILLFLFFTCFPVSMTYVGVKSLDESILLGVWHIFTGIFIYFSWFIQVLTDISNPDAVWKYIVISLYCLGSGFMGVAGIYLLAIGYINFSLIAFSSFVCFQVIVVFIKLVLRYC